MTGRDNKWLLEQTSFLLFLIAASLGFAVILSPYFAAILWAVIAAILFAPVNRRLLTAMPGRVNLAAMLTLLLIIALIVVPALFLAGYVFQEATTLYLRLRSGQIDIGGMLESLHRLLPHWLSRILQHVGLGNIQSIETRLSAGLANSLQVVASQLYAIGQGALGFVVTLGMALYLSFFLLRDGGRLLERVGSAVPLGADRRHVLACRFVDVIRATMRGTFVVALAQGATGGLVFWLLGIGGALIWGLCMAAMSLLPAIGAGIVWVPVAIYLFATGSVAKGIILVVSGTCVIGMIDNVLRPILVGRSTSMPDYLILFTTLGGVEIFGFNGIVIGPVVAALFIAAWNLFAARSDQPQSERLSAAK